MQTGPRRETRGHGLLVALVGRPASSSRCRLPRLQGAHGQCQGKPRPTVWALPKAGAAGPTALPPEAAAICSRLVCAGARGQDGGRAACWPQRRRPQDSGGDRVPSAAWLHVTCHGLGRGGLSQDLAGTSAQWGVRPPALRARQVRSHWALTGRWRRPGITCCCGRSWRPRSGQAPRCCLQPPARTPSPIACPAPPPRSQSRAGRRRWRRPVRGSGSWPSRWALGSIL